MLWLRIRSACAASARRVTNSPGFGASMRWSGLGQSDALNFQVDFRRVQQGVVNQAMMDGFFDASFVIVAELCRNLHRDAEVLHARRRTSASRWRFLQS